MRHDHTDGDSDGPTTTGPACGGLPRLRVGPAAEEVGMLAGGMVPDLLLPGPARQRVEDLLAPDATGSPRELEGRQRRERLGGRALPPEPVGLGTKRKESSMRKKIKEPAKA